MTESTFSCTFCSRKLCMQSTKVAFILHSEMWTFHPKHSYTIMPEVNGCVHEGTWNVVMWLDLLQKPNEEESRDNIAWCLPPVMTLPVNMYEGLITLRRLHLYIRPQSPLGKHLVCSNFVSFETHRPLKYLYAVAFLWISGRWKGYTYKRKASKLGIGTIICLFIEEVIQLSAEPCMFGDVLSCSSK